MDAAAERTVSGRRFVAVSLVVVAVITVAGLVLGPGLREQVRQTQHPRTLREPVATGDYAGHPWEAIARDDGTANCTELRYRGDVLGRACDRGTTTRVTQVPPDGPTVAYGVAPDDQATVAVPLAGGERLTVEVKARDLGFPVGFWAVELPDGAVPAEGAPAGDG